VPGLLALLAERCLELVQGAPLVDEVHLAQDAVAQPGRADGLMKASSTKGQRWSTSSIWPLSAPARITMRSRPPALSHASTAARSASSRVQSASTRVPVVPSSLA